MKASVMSDSAELLLPCQYLSIHFSKFCCSQSDVAVPPAQKPSTYAQGILTDVLLAGTSPSGGVHSFGQVRNQGLCNVLNAVAVNAVLLTMTIEYSSIQHLLFVTINLRQGGAFVLRYQRIKKHKVHAKGEAR